MKVNDNPTLDGPFVVLNFFNTQTVNVTSDGTILYTWDTTGLDALAGANFGEVKGTYAVQVQYSVNTETIISPRFYVTVN